MQVDLYNGRKKVVVVVLQNQPHTNLHLFCLLCINVLDTCKREPCHLNNRNSDINMGHQCIKLCVYGEETSDTPGQNTAQ